jgi:hypothetical protein
MVSFRVTFSSERELPLSLVYNVRCAAVVLSFSPEITQETVFRPGLEQKHQFVLFPRRQAIH